MILSYRSFSQMGISKEPNLSNAVIQHVSEQIESQLDTIKFNQYGELTYVVYVKVITDLNGKWQETEILRSPHSSFSEEVLKVCNQLKSREWDFDPYNLGQENDSTLFFKLPVRFE